MEIAESYQHPINSNLKASGIVVIIPNHFTIPTQRTPFPNKSSTPTMKKASGKACCSEAVRALIFRPQAEQA